MDWSVQLQTDQKGYQILQKRGRMAESRMAMAVGRFPQEAVVDGDLSCRKEP